MTYETGVDLRGLVAGMFTTYVFWLQLQKTWVMKSVFLYGIVLRAWPIIMTNAVTLLLTGTILVIKLRYRASVVQ